MSAMQEISADNLLIAKLRNEDAASFEQLYRNYFPAISHHIRQNNGSAQDAEDVFQETVIVLLKNIREPGFILSSSLNTYLFSISKNLWLKKLRDSKRMHTGADGVFPDLPDAEPEEYSSEEKLSGWLQKITEHCQRILKAIFYLNEPLESLMSKMGWKNKHTAVNQKYKCMEQIRKESKK